MNFIRTDQISHTIGEDGHFGIGLVDGEIRVRGVDGDQARATIHYDIEARSEEEADRVHEAVRVGERRGTGSLEIDEPRHDGSWPEALARLIAGGWRQGRASVTVEVDVPRRASVRVRGVTAEVRVNGTAGDVELRSVSGDVFVDALAGAVTVDTVSGAAQVAAAGTLSLRCRSVSGDVVAAGGEIAESRLTTVSGDVELEGAFRAGEHRVETASGDLRLAARGAVTIDVTGIAANVRSEVPHRLEGSMGHRRLIVGDGGPEVRFRTMSGSLLVRHTRGAARPVAPDARQMTALAPDAGQVTALAPDAGQVTAPAPDAGQVIVTPPPRSDTPAESDEDRMAVLRAVERGELDVEEALRRLGEATRA